MADNQTFMQKVGGFLSPLTSGIAGLFQSGINAWSANRNTQLTNDSNMKLAQYAYSKDLEMWNKQNAYNSPESQMERFKAAGLNPNLVYSQGTAGNSASIPHYQAPTMEYNYRPSVDLPQAIGAYQDFQLKQAQIDNVKAQTENAQEQKDLITAETAWKLLANEDFNEKMIRLKAGGYDAQANILRNEGLKSNYQYDAVKYETEILQKTLTAKLENILADTLHKNQSIENLKQSKLYNEQQTAHQKVLTEIASKNKNWYLYDKLLGTYFGFLSAGANVGRTAVAGMGN